MQTAARAALLLLAALVPAGRAGVVRVPQDYLHIQVAVNNAADGDVVLIQAGTYPDAIDVDGKSLVICADAGAVTVPHIRIHDLLPGQVVVLRAINGKGTKSASPYGPWEEGLVVSNCAGRVVIEDGQFTGNNGENSFAWYNTPLFHPTGWDGARIEQAKSVDFTRCTLSGGIGPDVGDEEDETWPGSGGNGLLAQAVDVGLHECTAKGGWGGSADDTISSGGGQGGHGARLVSGRLYAAGTAFTGQFGGGGDCSFYACGSGGDGGSGVALGGSATALAGFWHNGDTFVAGHGGGGGQVSTGGAQPGEDGADGHDILLLAGGSSTELHSTVRSLQASSPQREGQTVTLTVKGEPGDLVAAWIAPAAEWQLLAAHFGVLLIDRSGASAALPLGVLPASGTLQAGFEVPELPPGIDDVTLFVQGLFASQGQARLGSASVVVLLDAGF